MLGSRYRPLYVFAGVAVAFALHVLIAVTAGSLLGLLPHRVVEAVVAVLFGLGAILMIRRHEEESIGDTGEAAEDRGSGFWHVSLRSFVVLFVAEFGDLTQIATANLAAKYDDDFSVGIGALAGLWAVGGLAITGGRQLLRVVPFVWIIRVAAAVMGVLAVVSLVQAILG